MTHQHGPNRRLRALLAEAEWTQEALARAVNALGAEVGAQLRYDRTAVAHWLTGTQPRPPVPQLAVEALSRRVGRALTTEAAGFLGAGPEQGSPSANRGPAPFFHALLAHPRHVPYRVADAVVPTVPGSSPSASRPPTREAEVLREAAAFFAASMAAGGGCQVREALSSFLHGEVAPLLAGARSWPTRHDLLSAAGQLCFLLARTYEDGQLHGRAQRCYTDAHRLAGAAGHRALWSQIVRAMSAQAHRLGQLPTALRLAEAAGWAAASAAAQQRAYVQTQLAVAKASCGDRRGALTAIATAERAAQQPAGESPFDTYPLAGLHFQISVALERLGDLSAALNQGREAVHARAPDDVRGRALTQARLARLLLLTGRLDEACAAWTRFLGDRNRLRCGEAEHALARMRQALLPHRGRPAAAELLAASAEPYRSGWSVGGPSSARSCPPGWLSVGNRR